MTQDPKEKILEEFRKVRTDAISTMFNGKDENGIYPTTTLFKKLDSFLSQALSQIEAETLKRVREEVRKRCGEICYSFEISGECCNDGHEGFEDIIALLTFPTAPKPLQGKVDESETSNW